MQILVFQVFDILSVGGVVLTLPMLAIFANVNCLYFLIIQTDVKSTAVCVIPIETIQGKTLIY